MISVTKWLTVGHLYVFPSPWLRWGSEGNAKHRPQRYSSWQHWEGPGTNQLTTIGEVKDLPKKYYVFIYSFIFLYIHRFRIYIYIYIGSGLIMVLTYVYHGFRTIGLWSQIVPQNSNSAELLTCSQLLPFLIESPHEGADDIVAFQTYTWVNGSKKSPAAWHWQSL